MENKAENIDRYFKKRLAALEQAPRDLVWKEIEGKLGGNKSKRMVYIMLRIAAGMTLLVSLGLGFYMLTHTDQQEPDRLSMVPGSKSLNDSMATEIADPPSVEPAHATPEKAIHQMHIDRINNEASLENKFETRNTQQGTTLGDNNTESTSQPFSELKSDALAPMEPRGAGQFPVKHPLQPGYSEKLNRTDNSNSTQYDLYSDTGYDAAEFVSSQYQWAVGSEIAPLYSYRTISSDYLSNSYMNDLDKNESGMVALAGGLNVSLSKGRRLSLQSGVYYSRYGQEKNNVEAYTAQFTNQSPETRNSTYLSIPNSTGTIYTSNQESEYDKVFTNTTGTSGAMNFYDGIAGLNASNFSQLNYGDLSVTQQFEYIEVPLTMKYKVIDRKLDFCIQGGVVTNFLVSNKVYLNQQGESQELGKTSGINKINYQGSIGMGFEYPILSNLAFNLEPRFRYYINPLDNSSQINVHPYSFGIFAGISYLFR